MCFIDQGVGNLSIPETICVCVCMCIIYMCVYDIYDIYIYKLYDM